MSQDNKTINEVFKEIYSDKLDQIFPNPFIHVYKNNKERITDLVFAPLDKYYFIDHSSKRVLEFDTREEYENFLHDIKFNNEFEDKLK